MTRAQVRNLEERSALWVAKHLVMAGRLIDIDPELAFQHALAASRRGGRLAAVREAVGLTAYAAGHYGEALREFRTFRRISGSNVHLPVMADCERGLGRPDRALDLARSEEAESLDTAGKAELAMVVSGARADLGQLDAAVAALEIPQLDLHRAFSFSPRLFRAYAAALDAAGRSSESDTWRRQAGVAEKALGLDDDLEPDIIDLGEDDDPAPLPVPKVSEVLGTNTPDAPTGPADDDATEVTVEVPTDGQAQPGNGVTTGDAEGAPTAADDAGDGADDMDTGEGAIDIDASDAPGEIAVVAGSDPAGGPKPNPVGDMSLDLEADLDAQGEDRPAAGTLDMTFSDADTADATDSETPTATDEPDEPVAVPVDAVPAGETSAPVEALQTEMLFSMDGSGTADLPATDEVGRGEESGEPTGSGSEDQAGAAPDSGALPDEATAPKRKRPSRAKASQEDVVDD